MGAADPGVTPRDTVARDGTATLSRFRRPPEAAGRPVGAAPVLVVPSLINRWYVVDLEERTSLVGALARAGYLVYCIDWGIPEDEDRFLGWDDVLRRLARLARAARRDAGEDELVVLGYCMGATLAGIHVAQHPGEVAGFVNLLGPFDFHKGGMLASMVDPRWFDAEAVVAGGNLPAPMMQAGFVGLRPTAQLAKWVGLLDRAGDDTARASFEALEGWASDNVPFPAAAYQTYIRELYQENRLIRGAHAACGERVDLGDIRCPILTIVASGDRICPPEAALALHDVAGSAGKQTVIIPGGHVGAVVGSRAPQALHPAVCAWLAERAAARLASLAS